MSVITDPQKIDEVLTRGVAEVIDLEHLRARMLAGEQLRIKLGIDPTSPNIHIGRAVMLLKLRDFQALGHTAVFIVGDETGRIGDTSDKESERPMLTEAQVSENMKNYLSQAYLILDKEKTETHYNSEWLSKLGLMELAQMANLFSIKEFSSREVIARRLDAGQRVSLHEAMYPLYQGYDSVAIKADVELGGTDQRFNLLAGRHIQPLYKQIPQDILMTNLIMGTDGRKMSSSWGNTINLTDAPELMFKKVMDIPDEITETYFIHCTRVPMDTVKELLAGNPRDAKFFLASDIVEQFHSKEAAKEAKERYEVVSQGGVPENVQVLDMKAFGIFQTDTNNRPTIIDIILKMHFAKSRSDAWRKMEQGGVSIEGEKIFSDMTPDVEKHNGKILKVGKNDFVKLIF
jgi:tyrosyl-tRNA synthetase